MRKEEEIAQLEARTAEIESELRTSKEHLEKVACHGMGEEGIAERRGVGRQ